METKQEYIAPTLKCVEVKVEQGFAASGLRQDITNRGNFLTQGQRPTGGSSLSPFHYKFGGSYFDNSEDGGEWE